MRKYFLYGAGSNCFGAIKYIGEDNIISVVDSNSSKWGEDYLGIPVISPKQFLEEYNDEIVVISAFLPREAIREALNKMGISEIYIFPLIHTSCLTADEIIDKWKLNEYKKPIFIGDLCLTRIITDRLGIDNKKCCYEEAPECSLLDTSDGIFYLSNEPAVFNQMNHYAFTDIWNEMSVDFNEKYRKIARLKDRYKGRRCFLIGNGPSLKAADLEVLHKNNEISFATNRIHLIYPETNWRPDFYFLIDAKELYHNINELNRENMTFIIKDVIGNNIEDRDNIYKFRNIDMDYKDKAPMFSYDMEERLYSGRSSMYQMIQVAAYMGFSEIYLLGVDASYGTDGRNFHFCNDYGLNKNGKIEDVGYNEIYNSETFDAYRSAKLHVEQIGMKIYNATRGGYLEVFERVNFNDLF